MSRTRDIIQEIVESRKRRRFGMAMVELPVRLSAIEDAFRSHNKRPPELSRYFPVALVACIEGYFKLAIRELIDLGEPFLANAGQLCSGLKLDFSIIRAVHGRKITIGEFVAHSISISKLDSIEFILSSLLGSSFLSKLRTTTDRWAHEVEGKTEDVILADPDKVFASVSRTFEMRHIICHEIASAYEFDVTEIEACIFGSAAFLRAADELISKTMYPDAPLTQAAINAAAAKDLADAESRLSTVVEELTTRYGEDWRSRFREIQTKWESYCDSWVSLHVGDPRYGGTSWGERYAVAKERLVETWLSELERVRNQQEGDM